MHRYLAHLTLFATLLLVMMSPGDARAHEKGDEAKPAPPVSMQIIAPSAKGPWLLRIDNESDGQVRIAADVRLLTLSVRSPSKKPPVVTLVRNSSGRLSEVAKDTP